jgi:hypothetical protein
MNSFSTTIEPNDEISELRGMIFNPGGEDIPREKNAFL